MELTQLKELVKQLKKTMKEERKLKSAIETLVGQILLQQKSVFEPRVEVKDIKVDEQGETISDKVFADAYVGEVASPKDVPGEQPDITGLN